MTTKDHNERWTLQAHIISKDGEDGYLVLRFYKDDLSDPMYMSVDYSLPSWYDHGFVVADPSNDLPKYEFVQGTNRLPIDYCRRLWNWLVERCGWKRVVYIDDFI